MYAHTFWLKTLFQAKEISNLIYKYVAMYSSAKQEGQGLAGVLRNNQEAQRMWTPLNSVPLWSSLSQLVMWLQKNRLSQISHYYGVKNLSTACLFL